jgi:hypothetical protein
VSRQTEEWNVTAAAWGSHEQKPQTRCLGISGARQSGMQKFGPEIENTAYTFVDRPKASLRVASLLVWSVSGFLLYKAVVEPPAETWALWGGLAIFAVCSSARRALRLSARCSAKSWFRKLLRGAKGSWSLRFRLTPVSKYSNARVTTTVPTGFELNR